MKTIGVIGLGSIGMRHAKNLKAMGHNVIGFDPIAVGDGFASIWPIRRLDELDAIVIASPTHKHYEHIHACGVRPFLVEKPIAHTISDGLLLSRSVAECVVGYNLRFHGCVKKAKEWLDSGKIGDPIWANFTLGQHSEKPPYLRDGVILNWSHEIDLALYLLGPAGVASSITRVRDGNDYMTDIILLQERADGHKVSTTIHLDYLTAPEQRYFTITGTKGRIFMDVAAWTGSLISPGWEEDFDLRNKDWNQTYIEEMQAFLDRIDGKETIGCTGEEGLEVLKICLEVRKQAGLP